MPFGWRRKKNRRGRKVERFFASIFFGGRLRWTANVIGTMGAGINFSRERRRRRAIGCTAAHFEAKPDGCRCCSGFQKGHLGWVFAAAVRCQKGDFSVLFLVLNHFAFLEPPLPHFLLRSPKQPIFFPTSNPLFSPYENCTGTDGRPSKAVSTGRNGQQHGRGGWIVPRIPPSAPIPHLCARQKAWLCSDRGRDGTGKTFTTTFGTK